MTTLAEIMQDISEPGTTRIAAANALLDRGWGKPLQTLAGPDANSPITLHLLAAQLVSKEDLAANDQTPPTIQHAPTNGHAFDLNAPPPLE